MLPEADDTLALMTVANDRTGTAMNGHYHVQLTYLEPPGL